MTPNELAKKCGLTESYILSVEAGKKIAPETVIEKLMTTLGGAYEQLDPTSLADREPKIAAAPTRANQSGSNNQAGSKPTETVQLTGQWMDALAGVIRTYPIMRGNKQQGEIEMVIANKKIEGTHPDHISFVLSQETIDSFRICDGDLLTLSTDLTMINDKMYYIQYYGKYLVRKLRKEHNGQLTISPGLSGGASEQVPIQQIKTLGRVLKVSFSPK